MKRNRLLTRSTAVLLLLAMLGTVGCGSEHAVTKSEFKKLTFQLDEGPFQVEGESFSGDVVVREGEDSLRILMEFDDGYPDGQWVTWHENGEKAREFEHVEWDAENEKLVRTGATRDWDEHGTLRKEQIYNDEHDLLKSREWCENGELNRIMESTDDSGRHRQRFACDNGNRILEETTNADGQRIGEYIESYESGQKKVEARYVDGDLAGVKAEWYANGQNKSQSSYQAGKLDNEHLRGYSNGQPMLQEHYANGEHTGEYQAWSEDGKLTAKGAYAKGEKTGVWLEKSGRGELQKRHYGPGGFINPDFMNAFVTALVGTRERHNPATVRLLVEEGKIVVNDAIQMFDDEPARNSFGFPVRNWSYPVILATADNQKYLLSKGADINQVDSQGRNRVGFCAKYFNHRVGQFHMSCDLADLKSAIALGADVKRTDIHGNSALHLLVQSWNSDRGRRDSESLRDARIEAVKALVAAGTPIDAQGSDGKTALMHAVQARQLPLTMALLNLGADVKLASESGAKAVHFVFLVNDDRYQMRLDEYSQQVLKALVARGANVNAPMQWNGKSVTLRDLALRHGLAKLVHYIDSLG